MNMLFNNLTIVSFESRMANFVARYIVGHGGNLIQAPAMEEVPLANHPDIEAFNRQLHDGTITSLLCMTGIGTQLLIDALIKLNGEKKTRGLLSRIDLISRGPKPAAVLEKAELKVDCHVPEPNTWRQVLQVLGEPARVRRYRNGMMAIQEYGERNEALMDELKELGITPVALSLYRWRMPANLEPMKEAILAIIVREVDAVLFTSRLQVRHVMELAIECGWANELLECLSKTIVGSIGPVCSDTLRDYKVPVTFEAPSPRLVPFLKETSAFCLKRREAARRIYSGFNQP